MPVIFKIKQDKYFVSISELSLYGIYEGTYNKYFNYLL